MTQGDPSQHFYGFNFFNRESWQLPPGGITGFNAPSGTSVVYTDSIPILALPLKLLFADQIFQFHGIWILLCFLLQGLGAYFFLYEACEDECEATLGSFLLSLFPSFLFRAFAPSRHYSCLAHFLIFPALWLCLTHLKTLRPQNKKTPANTSRAIWLLLLFVSLGIHFYFFFINLILWAAVESPQVYRHWKKEKWQLAKIAALFLVMMWIFGYFVIPVSRSLDGGFGTYSMNFFSWINSEGYSILGIALPEVTSEQREGFQYLGLGLLFLAGTPAFNRAHQTKLKVLWNEISGTRFELVLLFLIFLAFSVRLSFFQFALYDWVTAPLYLALFYRALKKHGLLPKKAVLFTLVFLLVFLITGRLLRSSGRVGWYLSYSLVFILFSLKPKRTILISALMLQIMDVAPMIKAIRDENRAIIADHTVENTVESFEAGQVLRFLGARKDLSLVDLTPSEQSPAALFALKHGLSLGPVYVARGHLKQEARDFIRQSKEELLAGRVMKNVAYLTVDPELIAKLMNQHSDNHSRQLERQDQLTTLRTGAYLWIKQREKE